ncbi:hypothetical protein Ocin01_11285 [Orchesella cincta]|uniref:Uncharacterized protein n=1 Tax=Orchesella cincta TaxID=48709 RepID=A0A1D2MRN9_ORCCI|nr:hypothetical protein Ocin01_11285 [Orchesella cincta]
MASEFTSMYEKKKVQGASTGGGEGGGARGDGNEGECTFCERPKSGVYCNSCSHYIAGIRVRMKCSKHPKEMFLMDLVKCPRCRSDNLSEGKRVESVRRAVFETPPKTPPASVQASFSTLRPAASPYEPRQVVDERPPAKKKLCQTLLEDRESEMDVDVTEEFSRNIRSLTITRNMTSTSSGPVQRTFNIVAPPTARPAPTELKIQVSSPPREARVRAVPSFEDEALAAKQRAAQRARIGQQAGAPASQIIQPQSSIPSTRVLQQQPVTASLQVLQQQQPAAPSPRVLQQQPAAPPRVLEQQQPAAPPRVLQQQQPAASSRVLQQQQPAAPSRVLQQQQPAAPSPQVLHQRPTAAPPRVQQPAAPSQLVFQPSLPTVRQRFEVTPPDISNCSVCSTPASYVLCLNCGFYATGMRKYFACPTHNNTGGLKRCPDCNDVQLDEG